jgi:hypothetical protein
MKNVLYATGWCAHNEGHKGLGRSARQSESNYLARYWFPMITCQVEAKVFHIYISDCDIKPTGDIGIAIKKGDKVTVVTVDSPTSVRSLPYRHDWAASALVAAGYALANDMDLCYIEQDCLVYGLDKAVKMAQEQGGFWYGYGENASYNSGWAANSFMFCEHWLLNNFIELMRRIKDCDAALTKLEKEFQKNVNVFKPCDIRHWPFGVDRLRPIPWDQEIFYAQQLNDEELDKFTSKLKGYK